MRLYREPIEQPTHLAIYTASGERTEVRTFANGDEERHVEIVDEPSAAEQEEMGVRPYFDPVFWRKSSPGSDFGEKR